MYIYEFCIPIFVLFVVYTHLNIYFDIASDRFSLTLFLSSNALCFSLLTVFTSTYHNGRLIMIF